MTEQDLIDAGYRKWDGGAAKLKLADYYYAKMVTDTIGKKYQMVVYVYDYRDKPEFSHVPAQVSFMPEVQIRDRETGFCVNITLHLRPADTVASMEAYYEGQWQHHGSPYYERWEE